MAVPLMQAGVPIMAGPLYLNRLFRYLLRADRNHSVDVLKASSEACFADMHRVCFLHLLLSSAAGCGECKGQNGADFCAIGTGDIA